MSQDGIAQAIHEGAFDEDVWARFLAMVEEGAIVLCPLQFANHPMYQPKITAAYNEERRVLDL